MLKKKDFARIFFCAFVLLVSENVLAGVNLEVLIPSQQNLDGIKLEGESQTAEGQELFRLINGGAVTFLKHNFQRALFQEFLVNNGKTINLEIYYMGNPGNARGIYMEKKTDEGNELTLEAEGLMAGYYCVFWKGSYYITITGEDASKDMQGVLTAIARYLVQKINQTEAN